MNSKKISDYQHFADILIQLRYADFSSTPYWKQPSTHLSMTLPFQIIQKGQEWKMDLIALEYAKTGQTEQDNVYRKYRAEWNLISGINFVHTHWDVPTGSLDLSHPKRTNRGTARFVGGPNQMGYDQDGNLLESPLFQLAEVIVYKRIPLEEWYPNKPRDDKRCDPYMKLACSYNIAEQSKQDGTYYKLGRGINYVWSGVWSAIATFFTWGELGYCNTLRHKLRDRSVIKVAAPENLEQVPFCKENNHKKKTNKNQFCRFVKQDPDDPTKQDDYYQLDFTTMITKVICEEKKNDHDGYTLELEGFLTYPNPNSLLWQDGTWTIGISYMNGQFHHKLDDVKYKKCKADKACMLYEPRAHHQH